MRKINLMLALLLLVTGGYGCEVCEGLNKDLEASIGDITIEDMSFNLSANNNVDSNSDIDPVITIEVFAGGETRKVDTYKWDDTDSASQKYRKDFKSVEFTRAVITVYVSVRDSDLVGSDPVCEDSKAVFFDHGDEEKEWYNLGLCQGAVSIGELRLYNTESFTVPQTCKEVPIKDDEEEDETGGE